MKSKFKYWYRQLTNIPTDKLLHFIAGAVIAGIAAIVWPLWLALTMAILAGAGKEAIDYLRHGKPELMDFIFTAVGAVYVVIVIYLGNL